MAKDVEHKDEQAAKGKLLWKEIFNTFLHVIYVYKCVHTYNHIRIVLLFSQIRLTAVSHEAKKKQHTCMSSGLCDNYSELFTWNATLKFFRSAVTKPLW